MAIAMGGSLYPTSLPSHTKQSLSNVGDRRCGVLGVTSLLHSKSSQPSLYKQVIWCKKALLENKAAVDQLGSIMSGNTSNAVQPLAATAGAATA